MYASLCVALSGLITILVGVTLSHHRGYLSDTVLCDIMVISFVMCYTLFYTVVEPLRAAIKAVYVCFALHPEALSQTFPLVFHRLGRIASEQSIWSFLLQSQSLQNEFRTAQRIVIFDRTSNDKNWKDVVTIVLITPREVLCYWVLERSLILGRTKMNEESSR